MKIFASQGNREILWSNTQPKHAIIIFDFFFENKKNMIYDAPGGSIDYRFRFLPNYFSHWCAFVSVMFLSCASASIIRQYNASDGHAKVVSRMSRLAADMKFPIHIHIHIHRFFLDIHGNIHIYRCLSCVHVAPNFRKIRQCKNVHLHLKTCHSWNC